MILAALFCVFLALPLVGLVLRAVVAGGLLDAIGRLIVLEAVRLSLLTTSVVLVLTLIFGSPLALMLARRRFRGIGLLDSLVDLPIVLPPAVAGLALLLTFGRRGLLGTPLAALGIELPFTTTAVIVASFFVAAPFYVRAARSGFLSVPREYEEAARTACTHIDHFLCEGFDVLIGCTAWLLRAEHVRVITASDRIQLLANVRSARHNRELERNVAV